MARTKKEKLVPASLQPRKNIKKPIPKTVEISTKKATPLPQKETSPKKSAKENKKRFTLWADSKVIRAFKVHVATIGGSHSEYIENLIKKDLNLD